MALPFVRCAASSVECVSALQNNFVTICTSKEKEEKRAKEQKGFAEFSPLTMQINKIKSCWLQDHYTALARNHEWKKNHVHLQLLMSQIVLA